PSFRALVSDDIPSFALTAKGTGTAHRLFYTDGSGNVSELAYGDPGEVLTSQGASTAPDWTAAGTGDVTGPASSTDNALARFHSTTGKVIQNSSAFVSDDGRLSATNIETGSVSANGTVYVTAAAPSYTFIGDTNTGIGSPEEDQVGFYGNGTLIAY